MRLSRLQILVDNWTVFHVPTCSVVHNVVWVDDSSHKFSVSCGAMWCVGHDEQAKKIVIFASRRLVMIDPLDDIGDEDETPVGLVKELSTVE